jgi:hypothetical protein
MVKIVDTIRTVPGGAAIGAGVNVAIKKEVDGSVVTTAVTDANGRFSYEADGHFGPYRYEVTSGGTTKAHSSKSVGYAGPVPLGELHEYFRVWSDGVIQGVENELTVTSAGTDMTATVGKGSAIVKGLLYRQSLATAGVTLAAADGSFPRNDLVVVRVTRAGQTEEGKAVLTSIAGTPSATPADPALVQNSASWDVALARVRVDAGVTAIAAVGKITQVSTYATPYIPTGTITSDMILDGTIATADLGDAQVTTAKINNLAVTDAKIANATITGAKIATDTIGASNIAAGAVGASEIADGAVGEDELATNAVTAVKIAAGAVGASEIAAGAVGASELAGDFLGDFLFVRTDSADNPDVGSTTSLNVAASGAEAYSKTYTLPTGTWTVLVVANVQVSRSVTTGAMGVMLEIDGTPGGANYSTAPLTVGDTKAMNVSLTKSGVAAGSLTYTLYYAGLTTAGTTFTDNPMMTLVAYRTA